MADYIIVQVRDNTIARDIIRKAIHDTALEFEIPAGTIVLEKNRDRDYYGTPVRDFYNQIHAGYTRVVSAAKEQN